MQRKIIKSKEESLYSKDFNKLLEEECGKGNFIILGYFTLDLGSDTKETRFREKVSIDGLETCMIALFTKEGDNIPHFHIISIDKKFLCAIKLTKAEYFIHKKYKDKLPNRKSREFIDNYLRRQYKDEEITVWEKLVQTWDEIHDSNISSEVTSQPDYTKL